MIKVSKHDLKGKLLFQHPHSFTHWVVNLMPIACGALRVVSVHPIGIDGLHIEVGVGHEGVVDAGNVTHCLEPALEFDNSFLRSRKRSV
jgi:hypothetical protein